MIDRLGTQWRGSDLVNAMNDIGASSMIQPAATALENYPNTGTP